MTQVLLLLVLLGQAVEIQGGEVLDKNGKKLKVGPGTYIPQEDAKVLAKEVVDKNTEIQVLKVKLDVLRRSYTNLENYNEKTVDLYKKRNRELEFKLNSWWNQWGKIVLFCALSAGTAAIVTYEVVR